MTSLASAAAAVTDPEPGRLCRGAAARDPPGPVPVALVVRKIGQRISEDQLVVFGREGIESNKRLNWYSSTPTPHTVIGKIRRVELRAAAEVLLRQPDWSTEDDGDPIRAGVDTAPTPASYPP